MKLCVLFASLYLCLDLYKLLNMQNNELRIAKETFNILAAEQEEKRLMTLREEFFSYFSLDKLHSLKIEEYVIGLQNTESFCYWLERTLHRLGSISGQPSYKFGVWYSPTKGEYCFEQRFGDNYEEAFLTLKTSLINLIEDGEKEDYISIIKNPINSSIKGKILAVYFPEKYMNVYSKKHLDYYLTALGLYTKELKKSDVIYKRAALLGFKNEDEVMKHWSNYMFSKFLWSHYPKDPRRS